ncbi:MAG TPA: hypothetical protein VNI61_10545, partial [Gemmatimonadales bacterium]|nr:hypothetical protein [Gemmatimonadales bacterium]
MTTALLLSSPWLERVRRPGTGARLRDGLLLALGIPSVALWGNLFQFHMPGYVHWSEVYHYYLGAKYLPELGYTRLYRCTALADAEDGVAVPPSHWIRDLRDGGVERVGDVLRQPGLCKARFSEIRWATFKRDVAWFRAQVAPAYWLRMQRDHGFNATPVWAVLGRALASTGPASGPQVLLLTLLDPLLLAVLWAFLVWAFGWRLASVAAIYWGTSDLGAFAWVGGAYLRHDWLACLGVGLALLRGRRPLPAGFLLACASLLRLFPALALVGITVTVLHRAWSERRLGLGLEARRLALGVALAGLVLLPASCLAGGGVEVWRDFAGRATVLADTPATNHVGLRALLSYRHATSTAQVAPLGLADDPFEPWRQARRQTFEERRPLYLALAAGFVVLLVRALRGRTLWEAGILGLAPAPVVTDLFGYYYAMLLLFALLAERHPITAVLVPGLAAASQVGPLLTAWYERAHALASAAVLLMLLLVLLPGAARPAGLPPGLERVVGQA